MLRFVLDATLVVIAAYVLLGLMIKVALWLWDNLP